ncbi:MAG: excinuclease ABC subunit A [Bacteroidetes bacterium RIFOXYA12_FULL_35_11]|nr:MAG: excinuclease ABC subunit A [Bacteroidetes bacterium GWF2_35_48]OFY73442.1 MAG: excinuclease ABC subunit A [Bacteroidetes bacterium RIFOXYA12_FULL_35_11]OFY94086.1 MAG: excinuclease ABC subunit A [Bacteroidetes bacterium RIFOXYC12_FULL_35_7]HBX52346.1 excinuclease ABC subunit A [Bacteroidales bacterium]
MSDSNSKIEISKARVNNLKNISLSISRNKLIVITGLSGSGKSSLAFDTLYAEGQRRYVESLSSYTRQFLEKINKPEVDFIRGIPPAIAIQQKVITHNPRSTVGTSTEIYDYLKLLFARIGRTISPVSGKEVKKHTVKDVINYILSFPQDTKILVLAAVQTDDGKPLKDKLHLLHQQGFSRVEINGEINEIELVIKEKLSEKNLNLINVLVDRFKVKNDPDTLGRMGDSIETAFFEGKGNCIIRAEKEDKIISEIFSNRFEQDGITFEMPTEHFFSFNSPLGACPVCEGFGRTIGIDEDLVIPNKNLSIYEEAVACWKGDKLQEWKDELVYNASKFNFPIHTPYHDLTAEQKAILWKGNKYFKGIFDFFNHLEEKKYKIQYRILLSRYQGKTTCPSCLGTRLKKEASYVKIDRKSLQELVLMPVNELHEFMHHIKLNSADEKISSRLLIEIKSRLQFLSDVGLGYLTLNRYSNTLSGGESQRINLATSLGSSLIGSLYVLDEPSIGLHPRDTHQLIKVLKQLRDIGNTVIVVEHDEEVMRSSDEIIDIGPFAGRLGGEVVFQGTLKELENDQSLTAQYLTGRQKIQKPLVRKKWNNFIQILGARENNLKNIDVKFPLNIFTVITGVSGSGKSSLVKKILYPALKKLYGGYGEKTGSFNILKGDLHLLRDVEFIDQNPIGKSSRSNPVTYIKVYDEIRKLFASQKHAKLNGFTASHFSFNIDGGRCEECQGEGIITVEMQFMADVHLVCESCKGQRFKEDVLEVKYQDHSIFDILNLTIDEAIVLFSKTSGSTEKKIVEKLNTLADVGLGYIKLGQSSSTLSGGESQRVKLASFLGKEKAEPTLFIFDEPTTGLHFHDIKKLLNALSELIKHGHTVIVIEHNMEVIKTADWLIDLGPEGGATGGNLVFEGTPEDLCLCNNSYTGKFLKNKM